eukprot:scaffold168864_cov29-Tisochrysis_lutea.AAC.6
MGAGSKPVDPEAAAASKDRDMRKSARGIEAPAAREERAAVAVRRRSRGVEKEKRAERGARGSAAEEGGFGTRGVASRGRGVMRG